MNPNRNDIFKIFVEKLSVAGGPLRFYFQSGNRGVYVLLILTDFVSAALIV